MANANIDASNTTSSSNDRKPVFNSSSDLHKSLNTQSTMFYEEQKRLEEAFVNQKISDIRLIEEAETKMLKRLEAKEKAQSLARQFENRKYRAEKLQEEIDNLETLKNAGEKIDEDALQRMKDSYKDEKKLEDDLLNKKIASIKKQYNVTSEEAKKAKKEAQKNRLQELKEKPELSADEKKEFKKLTLTVNNDYQGPKTEAGKTLSGLGDLIGNIGDVFKSGGSFTKLIDTVSSITNLISGAGDKYFKEAENALIQYQGKINSRLQGTEKSYASIAQSVDKAVTSIPVAKNTEVMAKVSSLVEQGITYNVEQRAYIATVASEIVSGFNATAASIQQIVRVQREDSTAARLGMASSLQTMLNQYFNDTSYLTDKFESVASSLLEASSTMTNEQATEFEYVVQKWLGSLYSSGMDGNTISSISSALEKLGTGDISSLSSSEINLMAISANRAGLSFSDILTGGLNADNTNQLLKAMVEYLADISNNTDNNVIRKAYGQVFGISLTDLEAVRTVASEISNIYDENLTYSQMYSEANYQTGAGIISRMSTAKLVENMVSNLMYSSANNLVTNPTAYLTYKAADIIGDIAGANKTVSLVTGLVKSGMFGVSFMQELLSNGASMINALGTNLAGQYGKTTNWSSKLSALDLLGTDTTMRGTAGYRTSSSGTSLSLSRTSGDNSEKTLNEAANQYSEEKQISKEITEDEKDVSDIYKRLFNTEEDGQLTAVRDYSKISSNTLKQSYNEAQQSLRVIITGYEGDESGLPIKYSGNELTGYSQVNLLTTQVKQSLDNTNAIIEEVAPSVDGVRTVGVSLNRSEISIMDLYTGSSSSVYNKGVYNELVGG